MNSFIRYLTGEEKQATRNMYEEIFMEDSKAFVDYYYEYKTRDNQILVMEEEGKTQVMIHLNPFLSQLGGKRFPVNYIVAVATEDSVRKQGKMSQVMSQALLDLYKKRQPFTFLMPVNPPVYKSCGFRFFPDTDISDYENILRSKETVKLRAAEYSEGCISTRDCSIRNAKCKDAKLLARFVNKILADRYDLFLYRDSAYFQRLLAEVESEGGQIVLVEIDGKLIGTFSYGGVASIGEKANQIEIKEAVFLPNWKEYFEEAVSKLFPEEDFLPDLYPLNKVSMQKMRFMVRILDLQMLGLLLRSKEPFSLRVQVRDDMIKENNGSFEIRADKNLSSIRSILPQETDRAMDIGELAEILFHKMKVFLTEWV